MGAASPQAELNCAVAVGSGLNEAAGEDGDGSLADAGGQQSSLLISWDLELTLELTRVDFDSAFFYL